MKKLILLALLCAILASCCHCGFMAKDLIRMTENTTAYQRLHLEETLRGKQVCWSGKVKDVDQNGVATVTVYERLSKDVDAKIVVNNPSNINVGDRIDVTGRISSVTVLRGSSYLYIIVDIVGDETIQR